MRLVIWDANCTHYDVGVMVYFIIPVRQLMPVIVVILCYSAKCASYCTLVIVVLCAISSYIKCVIMKSNCIIRGGGGNSYEVLNLRALKISMLYKNHIFQCMGKIFCVEFQRVPHKISYPYIERYGFHSQVKIYVFLKRPPGIQLWQILFHFHSVVTCWDLIMNTSVDKHNQFR